MSKRAPKAEELQAAEDTRQLLTAFAVGDRVVDRHSPVAFRHRDARHRSQRVGLCALGLRWDI